MDERGATDEEMELGFERARFNRLCSDLAKICGKCQHSVLTGIMHSRIWTAQGKPDPKHMNIRQARAFNQQLEIWIEKAKNTPRKPRHAPSKAPDPPEHWTNRSLAWRREAKNGSR